MAEHPSTRLPVPKAPLLETTGNHGKMSSMAPPSKGQKRALQQPMITAPQSFKHAKTNSTIKGNSLRDLSQASGIARPASAASTRNGAGRPIDGFASQSRIGMGFGSRAPTRPQTARAKTGTAADVSQESKGEGSSDTTMSSRHSSFSLRVSSDASSTNSVGHGDRSVSTASTNALIIGLRKLTLRAQPMRDRPDSVSVRKRSHLPRTNLNVKTAAKASLLVQDRTSPKKSPFKGPTKAGEFFPNKDSNAKFKADFHLDTKLSSMLSSWEQLKENLEKGSQEQDGINAAMQLYKSRVEELDESRKRLEVNNLSLQQDLNDSRMSLNDALLRADEQRREHLNELDEMKRRSRDEVDDMRRKYNEELEEFRRARRESKDHATAASQEEILLLERKHHTELEDLRRQMTWSIEEEKRERKREVQALQDEVQAAQRNALTGDERHIQELEDKDERIAQLSRQIDREREIADDLRKQLSRAGEQGDELENAARSLKARVEFLQSDNQSQSQAFADLEQRTQDALKETEEYKNQLRKEETIRRKLLNQIQDLKGNIRVFCRIRPPLAHESGSCARIELPDADTDAKELQVRGPQEVSSLGKDMTKTHPFSFDRAFGPSSENSEIFTELSELVAAVCGGSFNTCIFSYGQTGSGKTYTMASQDGMISRAVNQIFDSAKDLVSKGWQYQISGSFVEVYNENINDLLGRPEDFDKKKHEIRHDMQKLTTTITDVIETPLDSAEHFGTVLATALENRSIAATKANERSSRSHSVCILRIEGQNSVTGESCSSTLNLVDLAGSERLAHSQAKGAQLKETQNINKSLSCLKDVIAALGDAKEGSHVPYRNSKLTYLLQNSLGGNSKTLMFVMISPLQEHLSETLSSLNFATKVNNTRIIKKGKK